ncbi:helix-turn-helix protein binding domain protein [Mycobacterium phage Boilgate]|nr:helix-turn-helix protein binding domain protein [Mycobacterium phage Boilgate]
MATVKASHTTREQRDRYATRTSVLDQFEPRIGDTATRAEVGELLGMDRRNFRYALSAHRDELLQAGYDPDTDTWTREAVLRLAMMTRKPQASAVALAAGVPPHEPKLPSLGGAGAGHVHKCRRWVREAAELAEEVETFDPAEVWERLSAYSRYELQAIAVALAGMVPIDEPGAMLRLPQIAGLEVTRGMTHLVARALAQLVPPPHRAGLDGEAA